MKIALLCGLLLCALLVVFGVCLFSCGIVGVVIGVPAILAGVGLGAIGVELLKED